MLGAGFLAARAGLLKRRAGSYPLARRGLVGPFATAQRAGLAMEVGPDGVWRYGPHNVILGSNSPEASWSRNAGLVMSAAPDVDGRGSLYIGIGPGATYPNMTQSIGIRQAGETVGMRFKVRAVYESAAITFGVYADGGFGTSKYTVLSGPGSFGGGSVKRLSGLSTSEWTEVAITRVLLASATPIMYFYPDSPGALAPVGNHVEVRDIKVSMGGMPTGEVVVTTSAAKYLLRSDHHPSLDVNGTPYTVAEQYGAEKFTNGDFSGGSTGWTLVGSASVSAGQVTIPASSDVRQSFATVPGALHRLRVSVVTASTKGVIQIGTTSGNSDIYSSPAYITAAGTITIWFRATTETTWVKLLNDVSPSGNIVADDFSCMEYLGTVTTGAPRRRGVLLEAVATNLLGRSESIGVSPWSLSQATVYADAAIGPDGAVTADKLVEAATSDRHFTYSPSLSITSGAVYTVSAYAKPAERSALFVQGDANAGVLGSSQRYDLASGAAGTLAAGVMAASIVRHSTGWCRVILTATSTATSGSRGPGIFLDAGSGISYLGDGASGAYVTAVQVEAGAIATSPIPNTGTSPATRVGDTLKITGSDLAAMFPAGFTQPFTVVFEWESPAHGSDKCLFALTNGVGHSAASTLLVAQSNETVHAWAWNVAVARPCISTQRNRLALAVDPGAGRWALSINGSAVQQATSGMDYTGVGVTELSFGGTIANNDGYRNSSLRFKDLVIISRVYMPAAALQALSAI